jgi:hypothetical protein
MKLFMRTSKIDLFTMKMKAIINLFNKRLITTYLEGTDMLATSGTTAAVRVLVALRMA